ncbi:MAG: hypothetical protein EI684_23060, partial [Candidatus Viridilinea halotolerans]
MTSRRTNKFADLMSAAREPEEPPMAESGPSAQAAPATATADQAEMLPAESSRRGRPATGKRSNPDYEQVTAYIRRETNRQARIALLQEGNTRDFSDL